MSTRIGDLFFDVDADTSPADKSIGSWTKNVLGSIGKVGLTVGAGLVAGTVAGLAGLEKIGATFDDAFDSITVKTGATGDELAGLQDSFKDVFTSVPTDAESAASAIGGLNQLLGLTGKPLEDLSEQFLNLSRITGTDVTANVDKVAKVFNQFGVAADDQSKTLDGLFRLSQDTGLSVDVLADSLLNGGVAFRAAGLTFEQSAGLLGQLNKAGLDAGDIVPALSKAMAQAAKDGKSADEVFRSTFDGIKNAGSDTEAAGIALDVFGAKAGPKLAALVRDGTLSLEDLTGAFADGQVGINETAASTDDWREKLQLLMNKALVKLEPLATKVFGAIGTAIEKIAPVVQELFDAFTSGFSGDALAGASGFTKFFNQFGMAVKDVVDWFVRNWPTIKDVALNVLDAVGDALAWYYENVLPKLVAGFQVVVDWVKTNWPQIRATVTQVIDSIVTAVEWLQINVLPKLIAGFQAVWAFVQQVWPQVKQTIMDTVAAIQTAIETAVAVITWVWDNFGSQIVAGVQAAWSFIQIHIQSALDIIQGIVRTFTAIFTGDWSGAWDGIKQILQGIWDGMIGLVTLAWETLKGVLSVGLEVLGMLWDAAWNGMSSLLSSVWDSIKETVSSAVDAVSGSLETLWGWFQTLWDRAEPFRAFFAGALWLAITTVQTAFDAVGTAISTVWSWFQTIWDKGVEVKDFFVNIFKGAIDGITMAFDAIGTAVDGVVGFFQSMIDKAKAAAAPILAVKDALDAVNDALGGSVNSTKSNLDLSKFGGPKAAGGPVSAGHAYVVGEKRPELFVPRTNGTILPYVPDGGGGSSTVIHVDARGSSDPGAVEAAGRRGVLAALAQYTSAR